MRWIAALCGQGAPAELGPAMAVLAHPDDETVGAGAVLSRLREATFVYLTDGAPLDGGDAARHGLDVNGYRGLRRRERSAALALCGIGADRVIDLGCPDQQAACRLPELAMRLAELLEQHQPHVVLTQPYEGGHPDHDATAFVVHAAAALQRRRGPAPALVEMTSYHAGPRGPLCGVFLPDASVDAEQQTLVLDDAARAHKARLLGCYASQAGTLAMVPLDTESFRPAPHYDFTRAPHEGELHYERHRWGMGGPTFRRLAQDALAQLRLPDRP